MQAVDAAQLTERYTRLARVHDRWRRRLSFGLALRWALRGAWIGLLGGMLVALAAIHAQLLVPQSYLSLLAMALGFGGVASALVGLAWPRSELSTAIELDGRLQLQERLSTAVELRRHGWPGGGDMVRMQLEDALRACESAQVGAALRVRLAGRELLLAAILPLAALLMLRLARPAFEAAERQAAFHQALAAERARIEALQVEISEAERLEPGRRQPLQQPLQTLSDRLQQAHSPEQALAALAEGEGELRRLAGQHRMGSADQLRAAGERLRQESDQALAALGAQLAQGDFQAAAESLRRMELSPATAAQAEYQARQLEAAAEMLRAQAPDLAQSLAEAAAALRRGEPAAARRSLGQAGQALQQVSQELLQAEMAAHAAEALTEARARLLQVAEGQAAAGDTAPGQVQSDGQGAGTGGPPDDGAAGPGQAGPYGSNGQVAGGGAGRGESAAGIREGSASGSSPIAQDNPPGDGGERPYQPLRPPARLGGEGGIEIGLAGSGEPGELVLGTTGAVPGVEGEVHVPYTAVFERYTATARRAIDNLQPPPHLQELVRQYFSMLEP